MCVYTNQSDQETNDLGIYKGQHDKRDSGILGQDSHQNRQKAKDK